MDWRKISARKREIDISLKYEILALWDQITLERPLPEIFRQFIPEPVQFFIFQNGKILSDEDDHAFGLEQLNDDENDDKCVHLAGTMDASLEQEYRHLYEKFGWRTIVYILIDIRHESISNSEVKSNRGLMIKLPAVLVSEKAQAIDEDQLEKSITAINTALTAMLLRLGVTFFASRAQHLWDSIPGALLLVSPHRAFECNDEANKWFDMKMTPKEPLDLSSVLPPRVCRWIEETIGEDGVYSAEESSRIFWLDDTRRVRMNLRPYRPWEMIKTTRKLATGYHGIDGDEINRLLHLLLLQDVTREWEGEILQQEISLARRIQIGLQPDKMPQTDVYDIVATCQPAQNIGGDLYDAVTLNDGRIALVIGDATGHGVHSALLAALVSGAFRGCVDYDPEPENVLESVDRVLRKTNHQGFVTLIYILLDPAGRTLRYGLAGHYPPMIIRHPDDMFEFETPSSLPLGVNLPSSYYFSEVAIRPGDVVAAFSDGILECRDAEGATFQQKIPDIIRHSGDAEAQSILRDILRGINRFADNKSHDDDLTAIIIKVKAADRRIVNSASLNRISSV